VVEGENDDEDKKVRTIKEIVGESETDLRYEDGLVVREENGTCSQEDRMRKQEMMARTWMGMDKVNWAQEVGPSCCVQVHSAGWWNH
jgi:hypothetical protein